GRVRSPSGPSELLALNLRPHRKSGRLGDATSPSSEPHGGRFAVCWLLTLIGNIGVFITADLPSFYLAFALVSVPAYGLLVHDATPKTQRAGAIYMAFTLLGENFLLIGFVLLAAATPNGSLAIRDCLAALPASPWRDPTLALLIAGFGLKAGLVPLHPWMPLTYTAAPAPAASVLSGAVLKAVMIGLIGFVTDCRDGAERWPPQPFLAAFTVLQLVSLRQIRKQS